MITLPLLAQTTLTPTDQNVLSSLAGGFAQIVPEIILGAMACVLFVGGAFRANRRLWAGVALVSVLGAGLALGLTWNTSFTATDATVYASPLLPDGLALLFKVIALVAGAVLVLFSWDEVPDEQAGEYYGSLLVIIAGLSLTGSANELITLFLALELISIPTYVLLYLPRHDQPSQEAAMKYFLLSVFSSALLLFGFSYLYGLTGTTNIPAMMQSLNQAVAAGTGEQPTPGLPLLTQVALIMVVAGLGFKITAVPFHFYAPDVYQGTPTVAAALLAFVPKAAGFAALLRVLGFVLPSSVLGVAGGVTGRALGYQVPILLWILAAVTMFIGNVLGLLQTNVKRILAYSSVAHAGYMLIGLAVAPYLLLDARATPGGEPPTGGVESVLFYLIGYGAMTIGAFAVLAYLSTRERPVETLDDLAGVSKSHPGAAILMLLFLFSLIGIPLTVGFAGKFMLFFGAMGVKSPENGSLFRILALLGVINAAIGAWYYLRIIAVMYLRTAVHPIVKRPAWSAVATMLVCGVLTLGLGFNPCAGWLLKATQTAARGAEVMPTAPVAGVVPVHR